MQTTHFVLVHGGGFGAWCWYKTIALLEESGFKVTAIDLTGSGIHSFDTNNITSLSHYTKPLADFFKNLNEGEKVRFSCVLSFSAFIHWYTNLMSCERNQNDYVNFKPRKIINFLRYIDQNEGQICVI